MIVTVARVSKFGLLVEGDPDWKNLSKFNPVSLAGVQAGDTVELELQKNKYITSLTKLGSNPNAPVGNLNVPTATNTKHTTNSGDVITRQSAYKAVLGSPLVAQITSDMDKSEAIQFAKDLIQEIVKYALSGSFSDSEAQEKVLAGLAHE